MYIITFNDAIIIRWVRFGRGNVLTKPKGIPREQNRVYGRWIRTAVDSVGYAQFLDHRVIQYEHQRELFFRLLELYRGQKAAQRYGQSSEKVSKTKCGLKIPKFRPRNVFRIFFILKTSFMYQIRLIALLSTKDVLTKHFTSILNYVVVDRCVYSIKTQFDIGL